MKKHNLKFQGRYSMAGVVKMVLRENGVRDPCPSDGERSHSHPGTLIVPHTSLSGIFQYPFFFNGIALDHKRSLKPN